MALAKILVMLATLWAVVLLTAQVVLAWGGGRRDYSRRAGDGLRGMFYIFTTAMLPAHKESVSRHPVKFAVGLLMHLGVFVALAGAVGLVVWEASGLRLLALARPLLWLSLLSGLYLLVRRALSPELRGMSAPDDYLSNLATCGFLAMASIPRIDAHAAAFLVYTALLLVYLPLGKLRHAVFFFVARGDYGRRLGYRGVYPPSRGRPA